MDSVLVVEDDPLVLEFLQDFFDAFTPLEIVGMTADPAAARALIRQHNPDLVLTDLQLSGEGNEVAPLLLRECAPHARIAVYSGNCEPPVILQAIRGGVDAYIVKADGLDDLRAAIESLADGERYFSRTARAALDLDPELEALAA